MQDPLISLLLSHLLPKIVSENFQLVNIANESMENSPVVHLHLEENNVPPEGYPNAVPNGFYEASIIGDFPLRDKAVMLHLKRRRWKDTDGRSIPSRYQNTGICKCPHFLEHLVSALIHLYKVYKKS